MTLRSVASAIIAALLPWTADAQIASTHVERCAVGELCILHSEGRVAWIALTRDAGVSVHDGGLTCVVATDRPKTVLILAVHAIPPGLTEPYVPEIDKWVVTVGESPPDPPTPFPPTPPTPTPPVVIPNAMGVGQAAYDAALKTSDKPTCASVAKTWNEAATRVAKSSGSADDIQAVIDWVACQQNAIFTGSDVWQQWRESVSEAVDAAWKDWTRDDWVKVYSEVATAMEIAAK